MRTFADYSRVRRLITMTILLACLVACGHARHRVDVSSGANTPITQVKIAPITVSSIEHNPKALELNESWTKWQYEHLRELMASKRIAINESAGEEIRCDIAIRYGNRALRYFVSYGAGRGNVTITLSLIAADGSTRYSTSTKAHLSVGVFGGDMQDVIRKALKASVETFGKGF